MHEVQEGETTRITVKFIGENTQCSLHSATLSAAKVVDFEDFLLQHSKTKLKVLRTQHLARCIDLAKQFANGDLPVADLESVNQRLAPRKRRKVGAEQPAASAPSVALKLTKPGESVYLVPS